jgi:16S rRNA (guanine966-N2)-methyltransferase
MGAKCLDLFAGSGVLSIEALSRGASHALAVDCQLRSVEAMSSVCNRLKACGLEVRRDRAENFLERPHEDVFDIVFVDPPFDLGIQQSICAKLQTFRWLSPDALIYVEKAGKNGFIYPPGWLELKRKHTGNVTYMLFQVPGS